jgi:hypothetical protein
VSHPLRKWKAGAMTDILETMKTALERDCGGALVFYEKLPPNGVDADSYIRFMRISSYEFFNLSGRSNLHRDRIQVNVVGRTHADLEALKTLMETCLYANTSDFALSYPLEGSREFNDGQNVYSKDFYIFYI